MCGIAGFVGVGNEQALSRMGSVLAHRGPDDSGVWMGNTVGLVHRRLAIVDLSSTGHQPMKSVSGDTVIAFNGEIYNYRELRKELEIKGRVFKSESDTEVVLEMFEMFGEESFEHLRGMFALALYDKKTETLYLARDKFGEKPLYWAESQDALVFASEPKAIFAHGRIPKSLNKNAVASYLTYDAVLTRESIYENIQKLEAAAFLKYKKGKITLHTYWHPKVTQTKVSFGDACDQLDALFEKSVTSQLVADVPVGVFLSGGLDSSLVAYYAARACKEPIHTFSLGFEDPTYDESTYAREVANVLGTKHHERVVSAQEVRGALNTIVKNLDEPISDPALLPNYLLAHFAQEHVTVALGGDGGDELFAGYQTFTAEKLLHWYRKFPKAVRKGVVEPLVQSLPVSHRYFSFDFKAKQFLRGAEVPERYVHQAWLESFNHEEQNEILTPTYRDLLPDNQYERVDEYLADVKNGNAHLQDAYVYLRTYMQDNILAKVDRSSMYTSLEVRAPFLDPELAEFALNLPWEYKYRGLRGKYILRKLMRGRLPNNIIDRKKHGFGLPVGSWFRHEWRELLQDTLSLERVKKAGVFNYDVVNRLVQEHQKGTHNHRKKLFSLFIFHLWYDTWIV